MCIRDRDWEGEADLWESMLETYNLLLAPGALRGAAEPGWFLMVSGSEIFFPTSTQAHLRCFRTLRCFNYRTVNFSPTFRLDFQTVVEPVKV